MDVGGPNAPATNQPADGDAGRPGAVGFTPEAQSVSQPVLDTGVVNLTCTGPWVLAD